MSRITRKAYAKINLSLDVLHKREDGYHEVCMVMHQIDLHDNVSVEIAPYDVSAEKIAASENPDYRRNDNMPPHMITLTCSNPQIPTDHKNIAFQAAEEILSVYGGHERLQVHIHIDKHIPVAAGLAGGSSNAAAAMLGINELLDMRVPMEELMKLGKKIGADVPFCLLGGCALAEGIGEKLTPVSGISLKLLLSKPPIEVSTARVYGGLATVKIEEHPNTKELLSDLGDYRKACLQSKDFAAMSEVRKKMYKNSINVLENVTLKEYPIVVCIKDKMWDLGAEHVMMSGSGPSVFAIFSDEKSLQYAYKEMISENKETFIVHTIENQAKSEYI